MMNVIKKCCNTSIVKYIFWGGCTTLVNLISYYLLRCSTQLGINACNIISIGLAILFAYYVNAKFVFESKIDGFSGKIVEFCKFIGARISTMIIEIIGVWFLIEIVKFGDYSAKFLIQFIVLILNYVISEFFVFIKCDK